VQRLTPCSLSSPNIRRKKKGFGEFFPRPCLPAALAPDLLPPPARLFISPASRVTLSAVPPGRRKQGDYGHGRRLLARGQVVHRGAEAAGPDGPCFLAGFD